MVNPAVELAQCAPRGRTNALQIANRHQPLTPAAPIDTSSQTELLCHVRRRSVKDAFCRVRPMWRVLCAIFCPFSRHVFRVFLQGREDARNALNGLKVPSSIADLYRMLCKAFRVGFASFSFQCKRGACGKDFRPKRCLDVRLHVT